MNNNSSNNTWTVNFILNANGLGGGDAVVTLNENIYEVEVLGDFVAETDTIDEAFALAEDMVSFNDAVTAVTVEVEEEIENLEKELKAVDTISHLLSSADSMNIVGFLSDEINEQLELLEALDNYDYDMFVEDREEAEMDFEEFVDEIVDELIAAAEEEEEVNGNVRGPFGTI